MVWEYYGKLTINSMFFFDHSNRLQSTPAARSTGLIVVPLRLRMWPVSWNLFWGSSGSVVNRGDILGCPPENGCPPWLNCISPASNMAIFRVSILRFGRSMFFFLLLVGFEVEFLLSLLAASRLCDHSLGSDRGGGDRKNGWNGCLIEVFAMVDMLCLNNRKWHLFQGMEQKRLWHLKCFSLNTMTTW